jgi:hypothetical protein
VLYDSFLNRSFFYEASFSSKSHKTVFNVHSCMNSDFLLEFE